MIPDPEPTLSASPSPEPAQAERRKAVRHRHRQAASCFTLPDYEKYWAWVKDISLEGVGLIISHELHVGDGLVIQFKTTSGSLITRPARVVHRTAYSEGNWGVGCEFDAPLSESTLQEIVKRSSNLSP